MLSMGIARRHGGLAPLGQAAVFFQQAGRIVFGDPEAVEVDVERLEANPGQCR